MAFILIPLAASDLLHALPINRTAHNTCSDIQVVDLVVGTKGISQRMGSIPALMAQWLCYWLMVW